VAFQWIGVGAFQWIGVGASSISMEGRDLGLRSSTPVKVIFGPIKLVGITVSMIAWEKGMGRALTRMGGVRSSLVRSPMRCKSLRSSLLALHSSSLFARNAAKSSWNQFWLAACSA